MSEAMIDGVLMRHDLSKKGLAAARKQIEASRAATKVRFASLRSAIEKQDEAAQLEAAEWLVTSSDALLTASISANQKLPFRKRWTLEQCLLSPEQIGSEAPLDEIVPVRVKKKKGEGVRLLHDPGPLYRTAQHAVLKVMGAHFQPRPFQHTQSGVHTAIARTKASLQGECIYIARLDIRNFYPSFDAEKLVYELPLPKHAVEHVVHGRHMKVKLEKVKRRGYINPDNLPNTKRLLSQARQGIPQGSSCSPIIGMFCISRLEWPPSQGVELVNYADDFLLLAPSSKLLGEAIGELSDAVANLPGGQFELCLKYEGAASDGFTFLGHKLRAVDHTCKIRPLESSFKELCQKLNHLEMSLSPHLVAPVELKNSKVKKILALMRAVISGWKSAFRECDDVDDWLDSAVASYEQYMKIFGLADWEVLASSHSWMSFVPSDYAFGH